MRCLFRSLYMPRISLTDATVRAWKPTGKQETYWCNLTPNFALRMSQKGGKSFFVMLGRERKRVHLGKYRRKTGAPPLQGEARGAGGRNPEGQEVRQEVAIGRVRDPTQRAVGMSGGSLYSKHASLIACLANHLDHPKMTFSTQ